MTLDDVLTSLFPGGHSVREEDGLLRGTGPLRDGGQVLVIGIANRIALGVDEALTLSGWVLDAIDRGDEGPILLLLDSSSQRMRKRDELLGLNEFLAHLAKCLLVAEAHGRRTVGLLYGHSAAGAFIATALATRTLVAVPGAEPMVMDLPSMAKVTKLPLDVLVEKAGTTPVFAPGLDNLAQTGAVEKVWRATALADQLQALLAEPDRHEDRRDALGRERDGRPKAAEIAKRVFDLALQTG